MRWMRTIRGRRLLVIVLIAALLPTLISPAAATARQATHASYGDWLRSQLRVAPDAAFEQAIEAATRARPQSLSRFLVAFVKAYETESPDTRLSAAFSANELSNEALVSYLERRYQQFGGDGLVPRTRSSSTLHPHLKAPDRVEKLWLAVLSTTPERLGQALSQSNHVFRPFILSLRILTSAQPLGP
jgi:hypothetical protein